MTSMFDPFRPAVFKAVSLLSTSCCMIVVPLSLPMMMGCQSQVSDSPSSNSTSFRSTVAPSDLKSPLAFTNPSARQQDKIITIASYNVENLFDQHDDARNESYGDYRIAPNTIGQASNYGEPAPFDRAELTFTEIKIQGIRKALLGIDNNGPDIIGLVEVESRYALDELFESVKDLGYVSAQFTNWKPGMKPSAVGLGLLSKYPVISWDLVMPVKSSLGDTQDFTESDSPLESLSFKKEEAGQRPILKVEVSVDGHPLVVYVNHWKSKSAPESHRAAYAQGLSQDIAKMLKDRPKLEYVILGDLNSAYNEAEILESNHNDTDGRTGINDVLQAGSDKQRLPHDPAAKYNLAFEVDEDQRPSAWYPKFGWSSLDHIIIGGGLYNGEGIDYVDGSFQVARSQDHQLSFLFSNSGFPKRWYSTHKGKKFTAHAPGGYSDHLPLWASFRVHP